MDLLKLKRVLPMFCVMVLWAVQGLAGETAVKQDQVNSGMIEIECNISGLELHFCPQEKYQTKEKSVLFGLVKSKKHRCSGGEIALGETPVKPVPVPVGKYILLVPKGYRAKQEDPIEIDIESGKRKFLVLKLFSTRADGGGDDAGAAGAGGGAGGTAGGGAPGQ
ncbi:MAG TPA: hypothetical protein VKA69_04730 [Desulfobacteria bacterium]|nr:hypothetical protein [Desulfobacteria bacterium]